MPQPPETRRTSSDSEFHARDLPASADSAHAFRVRFTQWVSDTLPIHNERLPDIVLAVYEAVANTVEHAYTDRIDVGTTTIEGHYRYTTRTLDVTVADQGTWQPPQHSRDKGRGIALMNALCENADITTGPSGTTVSLRWRLFA